MHGRQSNISKEVKEKVTAFCFADRLQQGGNWSGDKIGSAEIIVSSTKSLVLKGIHLSHLGDKQ